MIGEIRQDSCGGLWLFVERNRHGQGVFILKIEKRPKWMPLKVLKKQWLAMQRMELVKWRRRNDRK